MRGPLLLILLTLAAPFASAEAAPVEFDRPGFAFAVAPLDAGRWIVEQGLPDVAQDAGSRIASAVTLLRYGLYRGTELQLRLPIWNEFQPAAGTSSNGVGDLGIGVKRVLREADGGYGVAALATLVLPTGDTGFSNDDPALELGLTATKTLAGGSSLTFLAALSGDQDSGRAQGAASWWVPLGGGVTGYLELGLSDGNGPADQAAGGGLTWRVARDAQLFVYLQEGLSDTRVDRRYGAGFSLGF